MKKLIRLILVSMGFLFILVKSQAQVDPNQLALIFSQTSNGGTARITGIGQANTALGGDVSSISSNPAGLGFYNRSEVSLTPAIKIASTSSDYLGNSSSITNTYFGMANLGLVLNNTKSDKVPGSWKGGSFGFSYNRINDFRNEVNYSGTNIDNDYLDFVLDFANTNEAQLGDYYIVDLPYETFLINDYSVSPEGDTTNGVWDTFIEYASPDSPVNQRENIITSGYQNKWSFSYGGNFGDRFYFGFGLGIVSVKYERETIYGEDRYPESILNYFNLYEKQKITGVGVNGTFGIIVRPINSLTIGVSYVTPTAYTLTDAFETSLNSIWNPSADYYYGSISDFTGDQTAGDRFDDWNYTLSTPMRLNTGLAYFINKNGFITVDIEWVNYANAKLKSSETNFSDENQKIKDMYSSVINYRFGGEFRSGSFRFRAGYNYMNDPMKNSDEINRSKTTYSAGLGYRKAAFYIDMAILYDTFKGKRAPYIIYPDQEIGPTPVADIKYNTTSLVITGGFLF